MAKIENKYLGRVLVFVVISAMFSFSSEFAFADAANQAKIRDQIETVIKQMHPNDTARWWRKLGAEAPAVMIKMYQERQVIHEKIRLVEALGWYKGQEVTDFLKNVYETETNAVIKKAAVRSIAVSEGGRQGRFLKNALNGSNRHEKIRIARILDNAGDEDSAQLVDKMMEEEKDQAVRSSIHERRVKEHRDRVREKSEN